MTDFLEFMCIAFVRLNLHDLLLDYFTWLFNHASFLFGTVIHTCNNIMLRQLAIACGFENITVVLLIYDYGSFEGIC